MFETFPFPEGLSPNVPSSRYARDPRATAISQAAKRLDELRGAWLNPGDLVRLEPEVFHGYPVRILPKNAVAAVVLRERTLNNLYNQRPQWLVDAHRKLDEAVATAYGWPTDITDEAAVTNLLELNLARAAVLEPITKTRLATPEEARRSPQFKLPISGDGGQAQKPSDQLPSVQPSTSPRSRPTARGRKTA